MGEDENQTLGYFWVLGQLRVTGRDSVRGGTVKLRNCVRLRVRGRMTVSVWVTFRIGRSVKFTCGGTTG